MSLTHFALLNAQPREKSYRLFDGHGLYLQVSPSGGKWWRVKYRFRGREYCLSVGAFPDVALKTARQRCMELRAQLAAGVDPGAERRLAKQRLARKEGTFETIAREWYAAFSRNWSPKHGDRILRRLETYVFPWVGNRSDRGPSAGPFQALYRSNSVISTSAASSDALPRTSTNRINSLRSASVSRFPNSELISANTSRVSPLVSSTS
jgi:hypothetical protein